MTTQSIERFEDSLEQAKRYASEFAAGSRTRFEDCFKDSSMYDDKSGFKALPEEQKTLVGLAIMAVNILMDLQVPDLEDQVYINLVEETLSLAVNAVIE